MRRTDGGGKLAVVDYTDHLEQGQRRLVRHRRVVERERVRGIGNPLHRGQDRRKHCSPGNCPDGQFQYVGRRVSTLTVADAVKS